MYSLKTEKTISSILITENVKEIGYSSLLLARSVQIPLGTQLNCTCGLHYLPPDFYCMFDDYWQIDQIKKEYLHVLQLQSYICNYNNLDSMDFSYVLGTDILIDNDGHLYFSKNCHNYNFLLKALEFRDLILELRNHTLSAVWPTNEYPQLKRINVFPVNEKCIVTINNHHSRHLNK